MNLNRSQSSSFMEIIFTIIAPSLILMYLGKYIGVKFAFILALLLPLIWTLYDLIWNKRYNWIAFLGLLNVFLTGSIGLFKMDLKWLAIKEAFIPSVIFLIIIFSSLLKKPIIGKLLVNDSLLNLNIINQKLQENNKQNIFQKDINTANYLFASTFLFSSFMNFILAKIIVTSPTGSDAFNKELGKLTLFSYPFIAIPCMIMLALVLYFLWNRILKYTNLSSNEVFSEKFK